MTEKKAIKAIMVCAMGMSSSLLENKTREAAKKAGYDLDLHAITTPEVARWNFKEDYVDIVLVAPQVRYKRRSIAEAANPYNTIVQDIDPILFGMVDGVGLFNQILTAVKERDADKK